MAEPRMRSRSARAPAGSSRCSKVLRVSTELARWMTRCYRVREPAEPLPPNQPLNQTSRTRGDRGTALPHTRRGAAQSRGSTDEATPDPASSHASAARTTLSAPPRGRRMRDSTSRRQAPRWRGSRRSRGSSDCRRACRDSSVVEMVLDEARDRSPAQSPEHRGSHDVDEARRDPVDRDEDIVGEELNERAAAGLPTVGSSRSSTQSS